MIKNMSSTKKLWKDSASLIILGKNSNKSLNKNTTNYKVLVLKRSSKSSFMPNSIVFPGGVAEQSDETKNWIDFYKSLGIGDNKFKELTNVQGNRSFIFQKTFNDQLEREISLRITAIRETFEELGILICKDKYDFQQNDLFSSICENFDVKHWQEEVHKDSTKFLTLCQELKVAPDLWSTNEWSTWLTPIFERKRFETAFFIVALKNQPKVLAENSEVQEFMWETPESLLEFNKLKKIWLPPPQFYELSKLKNMPDINVITEFTKNRNNLGTTTFFPIQYRLSNGFTLLYPGDDFYPKNLDYENQIPDIEKYQDKTLEEFRKLSKNVHRTEFTSRVDITLHMNINSLDGHVNLNQHDLAKL